jgi:DNA-binding CsgD family transcriptional regulator
MDVERHHVPRTVGAAGEVLLSASGHREELMRVFELSPVPMVMVDDGRRYVNVNPAARLVFRLSEAEMQTHAIDDLTPPDTLPLLEAVWDRLLDAGFVAGFYPVAWPDGAQLDVVYYAVANALPGLHAAAFAPADWPDRELAAGRAGSEGEPVPVLTAREREVLQLAAEGLSGPGIAKRLVVSPGTVKTHFENVYEKLGVHHRAGAVARALRLGLID